MIFKDFIDFYKRLWADKFSLGCCFAMSSIFASFLFGLLTIPIHTILILIFFIIGLRLIIKNKPEDFPK